jgi:hypothetical protein
MGWPSDAAASLFLARPPKWLSADGLRLCPSQAKAKTQVKNVVRFRSRIATQHRIYAAAPNSRTMIPLWRSTSFVVITPAIAIEELLESVLAMWHCDLHASDRSLAPLLVRWRESGAEGSCVCTLAPAGRLLDPAVVHV